VLTDFRSYRAWNPFITSIEGDAREGAALRVRIQLPGRRALRFRPRVLAFRPPHELRWLGRVIVPAILDGLHSFTIHAAGYEACVFRQAEHFSGVLVPLLGKTFEATRSGFEAMNKALKARAEA
jgi:hypothetical protein